MPRSYPPEVRRKVVGHVASGRKVVEAARLLGISDQAIYVWRRQHLVETGQLPGTNSSDLSRLAAAASESPSWRPSWPYTGGPPNYWAR
ncbi:transposase [Streptomyces sp. CG1]|uniref:transposase n=1 Tax=Streptomyces sp. CG1 TaxID=1287523 RepID=UPI0034E2B0E2